MNWTVEWVPEAEDALADAWLQANDPQAVTRAQADVDRLLARDPVANGRLVHEGLYQIVVAPLTVFYSIDTANRTVEVSEVWFIP
jgi:mRNA-degrading endonuclease RelE of RelBE toxin-antitoxin system